MSTSQPAEYSSRVFVALDVPSEKQAVALAEKLTPHVGGFKIGLELFCSSGPRIVEAIGAQHTFLDLKLHDIPNTVASTARVLARLGVKIFNVHCLGGSEMMKCASDAAREENSQSKIIGVTVLTSHDEASWKQIGCDEAPADGVLRLAELARNSGLDGVVCSPHEIENVRRVCGDDFLIVTPGIRPRGSDAGDQKRVLTPREALGKGADWIVVGRPITGAADAIKAAQTLFDGN